MSGEGEIQWQEWVGGRDWDAGICFRPHLEESQTPDKLPVNVSFEGFSSVGSFGDLGQYCALALQKLSTGICGLGF